MDIYCAIIGDIIDSKKIRNRAEVQLKFSNILQEINSKYSEYIASNFTITLGDEFQGLLFAPYISYDIIKEIKRKMEPIKLVFGVGIGEMKTSFSKSISIGSDGPAYHYARNMVVRAKKKKPSICYFSNSSEDELINSLLAFIEACEKYRTKWQQEMVKLMEKHKSQSIVAQLIDKRQSTVSATLNKAHYYTVNNAEVVIKDFLAQKYIVNY